MLTVNYRGSTGFGKGFTNAGNKQWGRKMHDDLIDAVDWAVKNGIATKNKVAIMGGSYGGYATLAGLTFTPEAVRLRRGHRRPVELADAARKHSRPTGRRSTRTSRAASATRAPRRARSCWPSARR